MPIRLEVWGDYALFTRPEMKVERVSYDVMTPSAARGLIESIYWHPGLRWIIDRIHVCAPIRFTNLRRNEVKSTISARSARTVMERGRGELYLPQEELTRRETEQREEEEDRAWLLGFQEKVKAGEISSQIFVCPTCGYPRRERKCPICGSVVDLETMEETLPGDPNRK